jgi:hypothetical protein
MRYPQKPDLVRQVQVLAVLALLVVTVNPEVRALLFFVDAIGIDIFLLLVTLQLRTLLMLLTPAMQRIGIASCGFASSVGQRALTYYPAQVRPGGWHRVACPALITLSFGLRCRAS